MTPDWPPPSVRPVSRPPSLILVTLGIIIAMIAQAGTVFAVVEASRWWQTKLLPAAGASANPTPPGDTDTPQPTATSARPLPEQSVGPVDVTDDLRRGVVLVNGRTPSESVAGTGMILTDDGYILTNYHVVRSTETITVTIASTGRRHLATLIGRDATRDVALLKLDDASDLDPVTVDTDDVTVGDIVVAAGNANGQGYVTAYRGNVLSLERSINVSGANDNDPPQRLDGLIETNAPAWPGDSGGPMFDADGEVLGMTTAGSSSSDTEEDKQVYAVPIREALAVVDKIRAGDESGTVVIGPKAYLGIIADADDSSGVVVTSVVDDSPAEDAGLAVGDTITGVDGQGVQTRAELSSVLDGIEPGTTVTITWTTASGRPRNGNVTVSANPLN